MKNILVQKSKKLLSGIVATAIAASMLPPLPVMAEGTTEKYPYTLFAASNEESGININSGNFCVNGNVATNGTIASIGNMNINGTKIENANESMIFIFNKIDSQYFSTDDVEKFTDNYTIEETNININTPTEVMGETTLTGNININTALKSLEDVNLYGEVKNTNDSVIFSKYGDIIIDSQNVNLNGLVYAPFGDVEITAQNLNLNNVVIIADTITFNCPNVNANYSSNAAEFVGTVSEPLDIPVNEWQYMKDKNENGILDFFESYNNWTSMLDSDDDSIPNMIENCIETDPYNPDTDSDSLPDPYELSELNTKPTLSDTDDNGVLDCDEDFDEDGLTNYEEYIRNTFPLINDTDNDSLTDGEEVNTYGTNPLEPDTDFDGLEDSDEIYLGTDPTLTDTDGDGIFDCDEKFNQTFTHIVENEDCAIEEVIISMEGTGNLQTNTTIESVMDKDVICSEVEGLIGEPFSIETTSQFDIATLTFKIDSNKLGDTEFDNLMFLWYNEESSEFIELETFYDYENNSVSIKTNHFSKYMVIDKDKWFETWTVEFSYNATEGVPGAPSIPTKYNTVLAIDVSGSMEQNDKIEIWNGISSAHDGKYPYTCNRITAAEQLLKYMLPNSETAIVFFTDQANVAATMTNNVETLKLALQKMRDGGGTSFSAALNTSIEQIDCANNPSSISIKNRIILLSDGDDNDSSTSRNAAIRACRDKNIEVYTVGFGSANDRILQQIADATGGKYYAALTADEIVDIFAEFGYMDDFDMTDTDNDGLPDAVEVSGIRLQNGSILKDVDSDGIIFTDPTDPDTDDDGLLDGEEIDPTPRIHILPEKMFDPNIYGPYQGKPSYYFTARSDPREQDSDDDGLYDGQRVVYDVTYSKPILVVDGYRENDLADSSKYKIMIPIDDNPLTVSDFADAWKAQMQSMENGTIATEYSDDRGSDNDVMEELADDADFWVDFLLKKDWLVNKDLIGTIEKMFKSSAQGDTAEEWGADFLDFIFDKDGIAYHSQVETWQRAFGYNDLYDDVFEYGSKMDRNRLRFYYNGDEYILWAWKGDYWNLQSGGETGLYVLDRYVGQTDHYNVVDYELPMTLSLYKGRGEQMKSIFNWAPTEEQWWVTGFNPDYTNPNPDEMTMICSVDFTNYEEMYKAFHRNYISDKPIDVIFDEYYQTIWFVWQ